MNYLKSIIWVKISDLLSSFTLNLENVTLILSLCMVKLNL